MAGALCERRVVICMVRKMKQGRKLHRNSNCSKDVLEIYVNDFNIFMIKERTLYLGKVGYGV